MCCIQVIHKPSIADSSNARLIGGTGDARFSVYCSAGLPKGVKVCPGANILGFFTPPLGASKLVDSLFRSPSTVSFFSAMELDEELFWKVASPGFVGLLPSANKSPGGREPDQEKR